MQGTGALDVQRRDAQVAVVGQCLGNQVLQSRVHEKIAPAQVGHHLATGRSRHWPLRGNGRLGRRQGRFEIGTGTGQHGADEHAGQSEPAFAGPGQCKGQGIIHVHALPPARPQSVQSVQPVKGVQRPPVWPRTPAAPQ